MKPRKKILLYGTDETALAALRLVLDARGYWPVTVATPEAVLVWVREARGKYAEQAGSICAVLLVGADVGELADAVERADRYRDVLTLKPERALYVARKRCGVEDMLRWLAVGISRQRYTMRHRTAKRHAGGSIQQRSLARRAEVA